MKEGKGGKQVGNTPKGKTASKPFHNKGKSPAAKSQKAAKGNKNQQQNNAKENTAAAATHKPFTGVKSDQVTVVG